MDLPVKPKLRGVLHEIAFYVSLVTGPILIVVARAGSVLATAVYSLAMTALFGVSALYHRPTWPPNIRRWLGRITSRRGEEKLNGAQPNFPALNHKDII